MKSKISIDDFEMPLYKWAKVTLKLDISAETPSSFDKNTVVRPVAENCNALGFTSKEFSE